MICGKTSDFIDRPLSKHFVPAHGGLPPRLGPRPPPSKSGAKLKDEQTLKWFNRFWHGMTRSALPHAFMHVSTQGAPHLRHLPNLACHSKPFWLFQVVALLPIFIILITFDLNNNHQL